MKRSFSTPILPSRSKKTIFVVIAVVAMVLIGFILRATFFRDRAVSQIRESWGGGFFSFLNKSDANDASINIISMNGEDLVVESLKEGEGEVVKEGDEVVVHYVGTFEGGEEFDSSRGAAREPFQFVVGGGQVIKGWDLGVLGMKIGEVRKLTIPSGLAYGVNDYGPIPGGSTLVFEIELLSIFER